MPFGTSINGDSSTDTETNSDSDTVDLVDLAPFHQNETTDTYLGFTEAKREVTKRCDEVPDIDTWNNDLTDLRRVLGENEDLTPQQRGWIVVSLAKSSVGDQQAEMCDNSAGLDTSDGTTEPRVSDPENEMFYYADIFPGLDTIPTVELDSGGVTPEYGARIPCTPRGEPLPVEFDSEEDVQEAIDLLNQFPNELSYWTEDDGVVEPDREVDLDGVDTEEPEQSSDGLPVDPSGTGVYVDDVKDAISEVTDTDTLEEVLWIEQSNQDRVTAVEAIEDRIETVEESDEASYDIEVREGEDKVDTVDRVMTDYEVDFDEAVDLVEAAM